MDLYIHNWPLTTPDCIIQNSITNESMSVINEWESLQRDLNLDKETAKLAWKSYQDIKQNYTLEVLITTKPVVLSWWSQLLRSSVMKIFALGIVIFVFQGNQLHWLACALYVACRNSSLPTVGGSEGASSSAIAAIAQASLVIEGNGVSLTR